MSVPHCVFVDGHALIHRAFHAIPLLTTSAHEPVNAVFGFTSMVLKALQDLQPECIAVAFDTAAPTFRKLQFDAYKAQRPQTPPELVSQFSLVRDVVQALGIPIFELEGYEADDLLGTISLQAADQAFRVTIVTGDLDALQLVDERVAVMVNRRGVQEVTVYTPELVQERYGFAAELIPDYKALVGDTSDNIPKVPGIGEKTASGLLAQYGGLEGIYAHLEDLKPKVAAALVELREQVFQSRDLATIRRDAPVVFDADRARRQYYVRSEALSLFQRLEFRSLMNKLPAEPVSTGAQVHTHQESLFAQEELGVDPTPQIDGPDTQWRLVVTEEELAALAGELRASAQVCFDVETTSTDAIRCGLVGIAFSGRPKTGAYIPLGHHAPLEEEATPNLSLVQVQRYLGSLLADRHLPKVAHHAKFDIEVLTRHGLPVHGLVFDTMIAAYLLSMRSVGLKELAEQELHIHMTQITDLIGVGARQRTMADVSVQYAAPYACADVDLTLRLKERLEPRLATTELERLNREIEVPLIDVLAAMELAGVAIDGDALRSMSQRIGQQLLELEEKIFAAAGHPFNVNSPAQLGRVLFEELKLPVGSNRRLKTGYPTGSEILEELRPIHPIVGFVLGFRELAKLKSTYVDRLPELVNPDTGRVHTSLRQHVVATGRLSSIEPNLQNIPVRTAAGREIRRAFIPGEPGWLLLSADYSQIELRVLAHLSGDPTLTAAFLAGEDIHAATAARVFRVPISDVQPDQRRIAKVINFGILYGMGPDALAKQIESTRNEAKRFIEQYFQTFPEVQRFIEGTKRQAAKLGYVTTITGRRRFMEDLQDPRRAIQAQAERAAVNAPVQGSAADIIKIAMVRLHHELQQARFTTRMLLQVHDELVFEVPRNELDVAAPMIKKGMEEAYTLRVPIKVEIKVGPNWADMEDLELDVAAPRAAQ
ncbi:MAG: DNA polymerase I [Chloroflexi bacterium]|nr:DNA polymerase I [Chloroflexota bacterium]